MKIIGEDELRDELDAILDAVEAGETFRITRDGVEIAELGPLAQHERLLEADEV
jgi:antitoxin (DNA-binding transcriptional repressor) of toxin-antitoxin stability system